MSVGPVGHKRFSRESDHNPFCIKMRSYGKNFMYKTTATYKERAERLATEWDVRLDVNENLTAQVVCDNVRKHFDQLLYVLVSGVEMPDNQKGGCLDPARGAGTTGTKSPSTSEENHVHLCIVLYGPMRRIDVLKMLRGPRKLGDEYCTPRPPKFTYAGWIIHHGKPGFKLDGEPLVRLENGSLPMDPYTTDNALKIKGLLKKWGTDGMRSRFKEYTDLLEREIIKNKIEKWTMLLEDKDAN